MSQIILTKSRVSSDIQHKKRSNDTINKLIFYWGLNIGLLFLTILIIFNIFKSVNIADQKSLILENAEKEVAQLRVENIDLVMEKQNVATLPYIEKEARDRLNYSKDGEIQFVISDETIQKYKESQVLGLKTELIEEKSSILEQWVSFFLDGV